MMRILAREGSCGVGLRLYVAVEGEELVLI
jgi:hypothetical protein